MLANARRTWGLSWAVLALLSGCSVLIDSDKKQCTKDGQCDAPYVCGSKGICATTGCVESADCMQPGICVKDAMGKDGVCLPPECKKTEADCEANELCDTKRGQCVKSATATCQKKEDCANFEGAQVCVQAEQRCGASECTVKADCTKNSPTATCEAGACVDDTWGCLGIPDPRADENSSKTATLKVQVLAAPGEQIRVEDLTVRVCAPLDAECGNPFKVKWTYDKDRVLVLEGLEAGKLFRIQLTGKNSQTGEELLPGEYVMYRPAYDVTEDPLPILMINDGFRALAAAGADAKVDPELGFMLMRIFDCSDREVEGVAVTPGKVTVGCEGDTKCATGVFYPTASWNPDLDANATTAGRAGIANAPTDVQSTVTLTRVADGKKITSFVVKPHAGWITYLHFWPWNYGS